VNRCGPSQRHGTDSPEIPICFSAGIRAKLFSKAPSEWKSRGQITTAQFCGLHRFASLNILLEYRSSSSICPVRDDFLEGR
jgi:hypothetical protein